MHKESCLLFVFSYSYIVIIEMTLSSILLILFLFFDFLCGGRRRTVVCFLEDFWKMNWVEQWSVWSSRYFRSAWISLFVLKRSATLALFLPVKSQHECVRLEVGFYHILPSDANLLLNPWSDSLSPWCWCLASKRTQFWRRDN